MRNFFINNSFIFLLLILSIIPLFDLLQPGLPNTHDGRDHVARIANFYQSLSEGNVVPRWAGNLNWGFGHPILMFLYPASSYLASLFHFIGFSFVDSVKLVFAVAYVASAFTMYLWLARFLPKKGAFAGAVLYIYAPYRFVDLYVRGAIGEHMAFVFPPLILYFLYRLSEVRNFRKKMSTHYFLSTGLAFATAGLLLSHNAISIMFFPFIIFYGIYLYFTKNKTREFLLAQLLGIILGFLLSAFFWLPAFVEGRYTLRDIVTANEYANRFLPISDFIFSPWGYGGHGLFSVQIGILHLIVLVVSGFLLLKSYKKNKNESILYGFMIIYASVSLFIMLGISKPIWDLVTILQKFQFPWRFLTVIVFVTSVLGAYLLSKIKNDSHQKILLILGGSILLFFAMQYSHPRENLHKPESFYSGIFDSTTDTGESSPIWSIRFMEKRPKDTIEVISGQAIVEKGYRNSTEHRYTIVVNGDSARIRENTVYFPGWYVYVDNNPVGIEFQDQKNRGVITFTVPQGTHEVVVRFEETKKRKLANFLSLGSLVALMGVGIFTYVKKN